MICKCEKKLGTLIFLSLIACIILTMIELFVVPNYYYQTLNKLGLFIIIPILYKRLFNENKFFSILRFDKTVIKKALFLGTGVYVLIICGYFIINKYFDLSNITKTMENNLKITKENFLLVALYISFINSFIEEFFFRGFTFLNILKLSNRRMAYIVSASIFALYHVAIMIEWVDVGLLIFLIVCLFLAGIIFNSLDEKNKNIYTSWIVHMFANFSINTVGYMLLQKK